MEHGEVWLFMDPVGFSEMRELGHSTFCLDPAKLDDDTVLTSWRRWGVQAGLAHRFLGPNWQPDEDQANSPHGTGVAMQVANGLAATASTLAVIGENSYYTIGSLGSSPSDDAARAYLENIQGSGYVTTDDGLKWRMTELGEQHLGTFFILRDPRSVAEVDVVPGESPASSWTVL
eukprot:15467740-Alexandrium_andersonii.AAC.1